MSALYNAKAEIRCESLQARVLRVFPDGAKPTYSAGQYGSLGLESDEDPEKLVKRAYSVSSPIVSDDSDKAVDPGDIPYFEFYVNRVDRPAGDREQLTPKLFALKDGDRVFCGPKIVGHYTLDKVPAGKNILLIGTTTGEAANNSIAAQWLLDQRAGHLCQIVLGDESWASLYHDEHVRLQERLPSYLFIQRAGADYLARIEADAERWCKDESAAREDLGFALTPESCHVFLVGDPEMIGAPKKLGGWEYEHPNYGLIRILQKYGFSIKTRFKGGDIIYESYW